MFHLADTPIVASETTDSKCNVPIFSIWESNGVTTEVFRGIASNQQANLSFPHIYKIHFGLQKKNSKRYLEKNLKENKI